MGTRKVPIIWNMKNGDGPPRWLPKSSSSMAPPEGAEPKLAAGRGQGEREARAGARLALDPDAAAVGVDDALRDRQAETGAAIAGLAASPVALEQVGHLVGRDAGAGVL